MATKTDNLIGVASGAKGHSSQGIKRDPYLDLLRVIAVSSVVVYHLAQMSPVPIPAVTQFTRVGCYGVDLFFVLSGWLIGGLYWRELQKYGNVEIGRFWLRRWFRTIPPYMVALLLSWGAVYIERKESFDFGYLFFVQNYYKQIPFFLVSWSLCIEEHFYLFLPLLLLLVGRIRFAVTILFSILILASFICRLFYSLTMEGTTGISGGFGYYTTATHLRLEGLILGFWAVRLFILHKETWLKLKKLSKQFVIPLLIVTIALMFISQTWMYRVGFSLLAFTLMTVLVLCVDFETSSFIMPNIIRYIAQASYSIYLTHALMLHVARKAVHLFQFLPWYCYFPIAIFAIGVMGFVFYFAIERTSIMIRDRWLPRRAKCIV